MAVKVPFIRLHNRPIVRLGYGGSRLYITRDNPVYLTSHAIIYLPIQNIKRQTV